MLKCCSLYSGSSGNSFFVQSENTKILIDAGVSCKKIETALQQQFNIGLNNIDAIFVTHEHIDHTKSLSLISSKYDLPVFATKGTWYAIKQKENKISEKNQKTFSLNKSFSFGDLRIFPFSTPHDAVEPCGFNIYNNNSKISIATDLGHIDDTILNNFKNSTLLMLESNYEPNILKVSSYPYKLKQRISSHQGHLSNGDAGETISKLINYGLKDVLLIHLSKENNVPEIAYETVIEKLKDNNYSLESINLNIAPRDNPSKIFNIL